MKPEKYRENAIRYLSEGYDPECRERLLSGEDTPHPVHELPIIEAHIAGAHSRDEEVSKLEKALHNVNEWCHQLRNKVYELRHPWISVEDRLPRIGQSCFLANFDKRRCGYGKFCADDGMVTRWERTEGGSTMIYCLHEVTHWMPIPELKGGNR